MSGGDARAVRPAWLIPYWFGALPGHLGDAGAGHALMFVAMAAGHAAAARGSTSTTSTGSASRPMEQGGTPTQ